jgi:hypothetical protein
MRIRTMVSARSMLCRQLCATNNEATPKNARVGIANMIPGAEDNTVHTMQNDVAGMSRHARKIVSSSRDHKQASVSNVSEANCVACGTSA